MDKNLLKLPGIRPLMIVLSVLSLGLAAATVMQAVWLAKAVTLLFHGTSTPDVVRPLGLFAAAFAARHTLVWLQRLSAGKYAERAAEDLRLQYLSSLFRLGPGYAAERGSGQLVTTALDGIQRFRTYLELFLPRTLDMFLVTLTLLIVIYTLDLTSGLLLTFTMPVLIAFFIILGLAARKLADKQWHSYQVLSRHFTDTLRGLETLRFLGRSRSYSDTVAQVSDRYRSATMRTLRTAFLSSFALDFFSTLSVAFVAVGLGLRLINGTVGLEAALTVLLLAPEYFTPVRMLGTDYHASLDGKEAWESIQEVIDREAEQTLGRTENSSEKTDTKNRSFSSIELNDIHVRSDDGNRQLDGLTTTIPEDVRKIGIVGESGAGKTTLLQVLGGFIEPSSGQLMIDGQPLSDNLKRSWQRQLAFIPQHPYLFSRSLANNVRFYDSNISDERILQVLEEVELCSLVRQLPKGIHEPIGEGGRTLSGGQAQRVALARALAGERSVWLLDEPTAHLDIETELELKEAMLPIFQNRRVFIATHRLHWMKEMDWILVLDKGRLVESGTHDALILRQGVYQKLLATAGGEMG